MPVDSSTPPAARSRRPALLLSLVLGIQTLLCLAHVYWHLTWHGRKAGSRELLTWTDMRWDSGPYQWVTILTMLLAGITALRLAFVDRTGRRGWLLVGSLFSYLAIDDALCIHEWFDGFVDRNVTTQTWVNPWLIALVPVFGVLGGLSLRFLHLQLRDDRRCRRVIWAAFVAMAIAIVLEIAERQLGGTNIRWRGFQITEYAQVVEEYLEALAPALLLYGFGRYSAGGIP